MKLTEYFLPTLKENPSDAFIPSHQLMLRAGLMRKTSSGLYSYLPYGLALLLKVENIIREEMNDAGALECKIPLLIPKELLIKSGRWYVFKSELFRLKNRSENDYALSPTNEENFTQLIKDEIASYKELPINLYQINYKFRDEIRSRFGVMRGKEFLMKDAYSFDLDEVSLDESYQKMKKAYFKIFNRLGMNFVCVKADSGAMGGDASEEFMVTSAIGEETIIICEKCGYAANSEIAQEIPFHASMEGDDDDLEKVFTPNTKTIKDVCSYLKADVKNSVKARVYSIYEDEHLKELALVLIRGDYEVNEVKLSNFLQADEIKLTESDLEIEEKLGTAVGFIGGIGLAPKVKIIVDETIAERKNLIMGSNEKDYHYKGVDIKRDLKNYQVAEIYLAKGDEGAKCVKCQADLKKTKGVEIGHIFKLGRKYVKDFDLTFKNADGSEIIPMMGCYGIGVTRSLAAIIEQNHDEEGIILPYNVAHFKVVILLMSMKDEELVDFAQKVYFDLKDNHFNPLLDDRDERPGFKFKDV